MVLKAFIGLVGIAFLSCSSQQEKTQEVFTEDDNYYDYNYYEEPIDPLTNFSQPYNRPVYQEPEVYYEEIQMMQDFTDEEESSESEEVKQVEREGARGYLYENTPPPESSEWFFEDY